VLQSCRTGLVHWKVLRLKTLTASRELAHTLAMRAQRPRGELGGAGLRGSAWQRGPSPAQPARWEPCGAAGPAAAGILLVGAQHKARGLRRRRGDRLDSGCRAAAASRRCARAPDLGGPHTAYA